MRIFFTLAAPSESKTIGWNYSAESRENNTSTWLVVGTLFTSCDKLIMSLFSNERNLPAIIFEEFRHPLIIHLVLDSVELS